MKRRNIEKLFAGIAVVLMAGCSSAAASAEENTSSKTIETAVSETAESKTASQENTQGVNTSIDVSVSGMMSADDIFTDRDLKQTADLTSAVNYTVSDNSDITITSEGVYVISGTAEDCTIIVDAASEDKVQIVLDAVSITNTDSPAIYVKSADKVFITTTDSVNTLTVTGAFTADGTTNTDAVIFSKDDIVINGTGTLNISSTGNGITSKDDLKITGGTLNITCTDDALEANDSVAIAGGDITITTDKDGIHCENDEDDTVGYVYICGGTLDITSDDDGIHGTTIVQIDGGTIIVNGHEGIEGTYVQINDGTITVNASDDGINAARKSNSYTPTVEINGGDLTIKMGSGDTDAIDSNGNLYITGGNITITAQFAFDYDGAGQMTGGTVIVNGTQITALTNSMMGGGMQGGFGGQQGGFGGQQGGFGGHKGGH
ncbi:MAG: carbohydrate-binding domain-containing protein [Solobacterium sp.]|nr:carbohydrate-binding domain-containing protein [Solobacterium sp.]